MAGLVESLVRMPIFSASRAIRFGPVLRPSSANTELSDLISAFASVVVPEYEHS